MDQPLTTPDPSLSGRLKRLIARLTPSSRRSRLAIELSLFAVLMSLLVSRVPLRSLPDYKVGDIARMEITTPVELIVIDPERTARLRQEEAQKVAPIFRFDQNVVERAVNQLRAAFVASRDQFQTAMRQTFKSDVLTPSEMASARFISFVRSFQQQHPAFPVNLTLARLWAGGDAGEEFQSRLTARLRGFYVRADEFPASLGSVPQRVRILSVVGDRLTPEQIEQSPLIEWRDIWTVSEARYHVKRSVTQDQSEYADWLARFVQENCVYDHALTEWMRSRLSDQITATNRYQPRQVIVQRGEIVTPQIKAAIDRLRAQTSNKYSGRRWIGLIIISFALFYVLWRFANRTRVFSLSSWQVFRLAAVALIVQLALIRLGVETAEVVGFRLFGDVDSPQAYQYAIPFASAALLCALLLESRIAIMVGLMVSLFTLLLTEDAGLTLYAAISGFVSAFGVGRYQQRGAVTKVGAKIGLVNLGMAVVLMMLKIQPLVFGPAVFSMVCGLLGGFLAAAFTAYALPLGESAFGILTDVKLLELSNVDLPLLRRLAIEAPGTYQHSFIVASLAEAAAKAIGANPLLVRIGSYYHDIGKLNEPHMYVENQRGGFNPHELLSPEESAQTIIRHVTEGIRMAQQAGLPKVIIDLIPQHHGTRRLHYFYVKAKQQAEARGETVDEKAFRYRGPKPQSIEAAIVMMADSAEASTRSLKDRSPENTDRMLAKVIETIVTDGQLDECNLRMRDLKKIKASFLQTLTNVHHERVPYPGFTDDDLAVLAPINYDAVWSEPAQKAPSDRMPISRND